ncbi:hypothetical protein [Paenarthrobacter ilicis]|uniref:hypothetical protein n=1 Tax=Paenarthrobacter ilicis TaxID=43665 RepID=UPI0038657170
MSYPAQATDQTPPVRPSRAPGRDAAWGWLIGLLAGIAGVAPWWITGAQLPLQNLWATQVMPAQMPPALLPLSQYEATTLVAMLTVGGALAGLAVRIWSPARRGLVTGCAVAGVLVVHFTATVQSFSVLQAGLSTGTLAGMYFGGLLAGVIASIVAAVLALLLIASRSTLGATIAFGLLAVPFTSWLVLWVVGVMGFVNVPTAVPTIARWVPAVVVGCALAWCGLKPASRAVAWVLNLAFLWLIPAVFTAVQSVLGTRVLAGDIPEMVLMGRQVLVRALGPDGGALPTILLALVIGVLGVGARMVLDRRGRVDSSEAR